MEQHSPGKVLVEQAIPRGFVTSRLLPSGELMASCLANYFDPYVALGILVKWRCFNSDPVQIEVLTAPVLQVADQTSNPCAPTLTRGRKGCILSRSSFLGAR